MTCVGSLLTPTSHALGRDGMLSCVQYTLRDVITDTVQIEYFTLDCRDRMPITLVRRRFKFTAFTALYRVAV